MIIDQRNDLSDYRRHGCTNANPRERISECATGSIGTGTYVEYLITAQEGNGPEHSLRAGIAFLRNNDIQFDVNAGIRLSNQATDFYIGAGVARRF